MSMFSIKKEEPKEEKQGFMSKMFSMKKENEEPKEEPKKEEKLPTPLYNINESQYPQKERLAMAIKKTNEMFDEDGNDTAWERIDTDNEEAYITESGERDWQKVYAHHVNQKYSEGRQEEDEL